MGKKILIIDDSPMILKDVSNKLTGEGYEVVTRDTALGSSKSVIKEKPDLIILDIKMPNLSGEDILTVLKETITNMPPILIFSEIELDEIKRISEKMNIDYLQKSNRDQLVAKVQALLA